MGEKRQSPLARVAELGASQKGRRTASMVIACIAMIAGTVPYLAAAFIAGAIVSGKGDLSYYVTACLIALAGLAARSILYQAALAISHRAAFGVIGEMREKMLDKFPKLPLGTVLNKSTGSLKSAFIDKCEGMEPTLAHFYPEMTSNVTAVILLYVYFIVADWRLALLSLIPVVLGLVCYILMSLGSAKTFEKSVEITGRMNKTIVEYISGIKVIKAFSQGDKSYDKYEKDVYATAGFFYKWMKRCQVLSSLGRGLATGSLLVVIPAAFFMFSAGTLSLASLVMCIIFSMSFIEPLIKSMSFGDSLSRLGTAVGEIDDILCAKEQDHKDNVEKLDNLDISVRDVRFTYEKGDEVLHGINMEIKQNSYVAFVGPSGSGKSTMAKLIAGFWDVSEGEILMGGHNSRGISLEKIYDSISFVSQDIYLFNDTIKNNIKTGKPNATDQEVEEAAKAAGCDSFINRFDDKYDTLVGSGGASLSGGERQRITIARALLKNSPIVILDEATAYIDTENEALIQKAVSNLVKGKTLIVIAHRLETIKDADKIYVFNKGVIKEEGSHNDLLNQKGLYADLWENMTGQKGGGKDA